jgi:hypothetical protein
MYNLYLHGFFFNFFIWNIKVLNIYFYFSGLTHDPAPEPGQPWVRFNNYGWKGSKLQTANGFEYDKRWYSTPDVRLHSHKTLS